MFDSTKLVSGFVYVLLRRNDSVFLKDYYYNRFHITDLAGTLDYWHIEKDGKRSAYSDLKLNDAERLYRYINNDTFYRYRVRSSQERWHNPENYPIDSVTECFRGNLAFREMVRRKNSLTIGRWDWGNMGIVARLFRKGEKYYTKIY